MLAAQATYSAGAPLSLQRKRWERKRKGGAAPSALPPMRNRAKVLLRRDFPGAVPFEMSLLPMRAALYCHARQVAAKTESYRQKMGRPPKKAALLEGSGEGNEKFPSPPFLSPVSFPRKEIGRCPRRTPARRAQKSPGLAGQAVRITSQNFPTGSVSFQRALFFCTGLCHQSLFQQV